ncbi:unnamed protein product, partial [marine sediment metagenome]
KQKLIAEATGLADFSVRDIFVSTFKEKYLISKQMRKKRRN